MATIKRENFDILIPPSDQSGEGEGMPFKGVREFPESSKQNDNKSDGKGKGDGKDDSKSGDKSDKISSSGRSATAEELNGEEKKELEKASGRAKVLKINKDDDMSEAMGIGGIISEETSKNMQKELGVNVELPSEAEIRSTAEKAVTHIEQSSGGHGSGKGMLARAILDIIKPQVNWKDALKKYVGKAMSRQLEYFMGNRRFIGAGQYLTGDRKTSNALDGALYAVDTSGSMGDKALSILLSEMKAITEQKKVKKTTIIYFDDGIQDIVNLDSESRVKQYQPKAGGGGGTSFVEPLQQMTEMWKKGKYSVAFFCTDGDPSALREIASTPPKFKNKWIWIILDFPGFKAPWGDMVVHISSKDIEVIARTQ